MGASTKAADQRRIAPERAFLLLSLTFGLAFVFITPPFQVPDEPQHFYRAYQISELRPLDVVRLTAKGDREGRFTWSGTLLPASLASLVDSSGVARSRLHGTVVGEHRQVDLSDGAVRAEARFSADDDIYDLPKLRAMLRVPLNPGDRRYLPIATYAPAGYVPQAIAIGIGRLLNRPPLVIFYLGRIFVYATWVALVFIAIKTTPVLKWTFVLLALMPMTLYIAASNSLDSVTYGATFLMSAVLLQWAFDDSKTRVTRLDAALLLAVAVVIALSKVIYLGPLALFVLVPPRKFTSRTAYWGTLAAVVLASVGAYQLWTWLASMPGPEATLPPGTFGVNRPSSLDVSPARQQAFIIAHPGAFVRALVNTVSPKVFVSFFGTFGWVALPLPGRLAFLYLATVVAVSSCYDPAGRLGWGARLLAIAIVCATGIAALTVLYLGWTQVGLNHVQDFQGRYLIPVAPVFFLAFQNQRWRAPMTRRLAGFLMLLSAATASMATYTLIQRYYVKPPRFFAIDQLVRSPAGSTVAVTGWAIDPNAADVAAGVEIEVDGRYFPVRYGLDRAGNGAGLDRPPYRYSGFEAHIPSEQFSPGTHELGIRILSKQRNSPAAVKRLTLEVK